MTHNTGFVKFFTVDPVSVKDLSHAVAAVTFIDAALAMLTLGALIGAARTGAGTRAAL